MGNPSQAISDTRRGSSYATANRYITSNSRTSFKRMRLAAVEMFTEQIESRRRGGRVGCGGFENATDNVCGVHLLPQSRLHPTLMGTDVTLHVRCRCHRDV